MSKTSLTYSGERLEWPAVYLKMFAPIMIVVMITIGVDAWVEYVSGGFSPFFYKDVVTVCVIALTYALFGLNKISKAFAINVSVYSIVLGIMVLLPFRLNIAEFEFETYFLKVEIILIILTYAIGILVHPKHILYLLILNLIFIAACIYGMYDQYPISRFIFYIMLMTTTSLLGYKLNRIFYDLNQQVADANALIQAQNEDLTRANAAKDQLFEILGHDLKVPFFHLSALLTLLDHTDSQEKKAEYLQLMKNAIKDGDNLVASILNWVDVQSTYMKFDLQEREIAPVVLTEIAMARGNASLKDIFVESDLQHNLSFMMDERMMETVIRNLISNAIKFSHRNSVIRVTSSREREELVLRVIDHGIGMSEEIKNELFKYGKIPPRMGTENESGSGFGLNICQKMVENQCGKLIIESKPAEGTTVIMRFPVVTG
ncbi:MAG: two-component system sensor histidine kinase/response regulator [Bacteroidia bacterium]|jgi:two-component system sensor histidine kinase/response regulator